jgi:hypothetical protein
VENSYPDTVQIKLPAREGLRLFSHKISPYHSAPAPFLSSTLMSKETLSDIHDSQTEKV